MGQRRKKRYISSGNAYPLLPLTGRACLKFWEDSTLDALTAGDLQFFMFTDTLGRDEADPGYEFIGGSGYLKARVYDGKEWQPIIMDDFFPNRDHHFSKKEMPIDTYQICYDLVTQMEGRKLRRGYRRHYEPVPYDEVEPEENS